MYVYDEDGMAYLDAGASYACVPAGHCHPAVVDAVTAQAERLMFIQGSYPTPSRTAVYEQLGELAPGDIEHVWLCNSGTEANEAAIKFARHATGRANIVATMQGFHGRTMGALSATWKREYREGFEPLVPGFEFVPYGDAEALAETVDEETAAVVVEPVQGEGGINLPPDGYLETVRGITEEAGAAMVVDEIQSGLGRTGRWWGVDHAGVVPDVVTVAKGLASGLPIGAALCREWIAADAGDHGGTFSGGPVVCAAAEATLGVIQDEGLVEHAAAIGEYLVGALESVESDAVRDVRGTGLLVGVEVRRGANRLLRDLALSEQVLALPAGRTVVRFLPPLVMEREDADRLVGAVESVLGSGE